MSRLKFEKAKGKRHYIIINKHNQILGQTGIHNGMFVFWPATSPMSELWFAEDCLEEIVNFMKKEPPLKESE